MPARADDGRLTLERDGKDWPLRDFSRFVEAAGLRWHVQILGNGPGPAARPRHGRLDPFLARSRAAARQTLPRHRAGPARPRLHRPDEARNPFAAGNGARARRAGAPAWAVPRGRGRSFRGRGDPRETLHRRNDRAAEFSLASTAPGCLSRGSPGRSFRRWRSSCSSIRSRRVSLRGRPTGTRLRGCCAARALRSMRSGVDLYQRLFSNSAHVAGALGMMANWDLEALKREWPRLTTKVALVVGDDDKAVPPKTADIVAGGAAERDRLSSQGPWTSRP